MSEFDKQARALGCKCGELFQRFVEWIVDDCQQNALTHIYFFAREGEFFEQVYVASGHCQRPLIGHTLLAVSRLSTYLPSLHSFDMTDWARFLNQYRDQKITAFVHSLGTPYHATLTLLLRHGLQLESSIAQQETLFYESVGSEEFQAFIQSESLLAARRLYKYLQQNGLDGTASRVAIVDIGWRGTIQDNLCYLFPNIKFYGYYLGLIPFLNRQPQNAIKKGFFNMLPLANALLKSHTQLEMICGSKRGSVLGYTEASSNEIVPAVEEDAQDIFSWENYTKQFQAGVLSQCYKSGRRHASVFRMAMPLTLLPDKSMARAFFKFRYSERFGLGETIDQARIKFSWKECMRSLQSGQVLKWLRQFLNSTKWPQGFLRVHHLSGLIPFYNAVLIYESCGKA